MSILARQILGAPRKRMEPADSFKPPPKRKEPPKPEPKTPAPKPIPKPSRVEPPPALPAKNRLLAGYLAHEFLTKGTLFGQPFDPARAGPSQPEAELGQPTSYADVAYLLKFDGTHIPGIVNPDSAGLLDPERRKSRRFQFLRSNRPVEAAHVAPSDWESTS